MKELILETKKLSKEYKNQKAVDNVMRYFCPFYFLLGILHSVAGTIRGVGKPVPPMIVFFLSLCLFRVICILYVIPLTSLNYVYMLYQLSCLIGAILMIAYFVKSKRLTIKERTSCLCLFACLDGLTDRDLQDVKDIGKKYIVHENVLDPHLRENYIIVAVDKTTGEGYFMDIGKKHRISIYHHGCKMIKKILN